MCHANTQQNSNNENGPNYSWQQDAQAQERLYPNLDQILNNLLPENQSQFLRNFFDGNDAQTGPSAPPEPNQNPSAPPPPPPPQENQGNRNPQSENQQWNQYQNQSQNQNQNQWNWQNWNHGGWRMPDYSNMQSQPRPRPNSNGNENTSDLGLLFNSNGCSIKKY